MIFSATATFRKLYKKLSKISQKKVDKQLDLLSKDFHYPSLNIKKMGGENRWEIRIDKHYRLTFEKKNEEIILRTVGPHDVGLGKK